MAQILKAIILMRIIIILLLSINIGLSYASEALTSSCKNALKEIVSNEKNIIKAIFEEDEINKAFNYFMLNAGQKDLIKINKKLKKISELEFLGPNHIEQITELVDFMMYYKRGERFYHVRPTEYINRKIFNTSTEYKLSQILASVINDKNMTRSQKVINLFRNNKNKLYLGVWGVLNRQMLNLQLPGYLPDLKFRNEVLKLNKMILNDKLSLEDARSLLQSNNHNKYLIEYWYQKTRLMINSTIGIYFIFVNIAMIEEGIDNAMEEIKKMRQDNSEEEDRLNELKDRLQRINQELEDMDQQDKIEEF